MARSGDLRGARRELDRLGHAGEGYPLQGLLRAFIDALSGTDAGAQVAPKAQPAPKTQLHVGMCRHCRAYLRQMRATIAALGELPEEPMDEAAHEELMRRFDGWNR